MQRRLIRRGVDGRRHQHDPVGLPRGFVGQELVAANHQVGSASRGGKPPAPRGMFLAVGGVHHRVVHIVDQPPRATPQDAQLRAAQQPLLQQDDVESGQSGIQGQPPPHGGRQEERFAVVPRCGEEWKHALDAKAEARLGRSGCQAGNLHGSTRIRERRRIFAQAAAHFRAIGAQRRSDRRLRRRRILVSSRNSLQMTFQSPEEARLSR